MLKKIFYCSFVLLSLPLMADGNIKQMAKEIDDLVHQKLESIKQPKRSEIDDYTFARRLYLDAIGRIPTLAELESFVQGSSENKRAELITSLLSSRGHQSHMYNYWADLLRVKNIGDKLMYAGNLSQAIKSALRENRPYDKFVKDIVSAEGNLYKPGNGLVGYKARESMQLDRLSNTIKTFTGMAIECAQCHDHPFDDWTQREFYEMAAFTSGTRLQLDPPKKLEKENYAELRKALKNDNFDKWIVYRESIRMKYARIDGSGTGYMRLPHDYKYDDGKPFEVIQAKTMFGASPAVYTKQTVDRVKKHENNRYVGDSAKAHNQLAEWVTSRDNPMFTKATVNRLWYWIMGSELVGRVNDLELSDEGKHPELTAKLEAIMKRVNYDTRKFYEVIFNTRTYQSRALALGKGNPEYLLDGPIVRRLSAEQVWDSFLSLKNGDPDKHLPTKFHHNGFTLFYDKSKNWTAEDFKNYSSNCGVGRRGFYEAAHREALEINEDIGPRNELRASESRIYAPKFPLNLSYVEVNGLFGASDRELIDNSNKEANIPQILYLMNGKPENQLISSKSYLNDELAKAKGREKYQRMWLAVFNRPMNANELELINSNFNRKDIQNMLWALLNSNEFRFVR
ncbi:DUF1549 domain-containing protein [Lentisphaera marina]|uniref:DUF1549 domain-containing protein n=1 Tax=Lentisphaera marina TaxID=1111041 RepID=UPI002366ACE4|nr:DUF1549 domain-containing protein [Lentisphaera marina]MDD7985211.1 DUF1549 domain-containing protein [Lentisphaera marina]